MRPTLRLLAPHNTKPEPSIPDPAGQRGMSELYQYQLEGKAHLMSRPVSFLADDTGLGKSRQAIEACRAVGARRIIVLVDGPGRLAWPAEFSRWWPEMPVWVARSARCRPPDGPAAAVVSYGLLSRSSRQRLPDWLTGPWDVAVLDEAHKLKEPAARRTRAVYGRRLDRRGGVVEHARRVILITATPTPRHAGELYTHMRALLPEALADMFAGRLPSQDQFVSTFCRLRHDGFGVRVEGNNPATIPVLRRALRPVLIRRTKAQVLGQLPPVRCDLLPLDIGDEPTRRLALDSYLSDIPLDGPNIDDAIALLGAALADPHVSRQRRALGLVKAAPAAEWATTFLEEAADNRKLVIFAYHLDLIDTLVGRLSAYRPASLVGGMSVSAGATAVDAFQNDPACRVFVGQIEAAGTAITLTAASDVLLVEPAWTPATNYQAISRCHRIGQTRGVIARFAFAAGTIDGRIARVLRRRAQDMVGLWGDAPPGLGSVNSLGPDLGRGQERREA